MKRYILLFAAFPLLGAAGPVDAVLIVRDRTPGEAGELRSIVADKLSAALSGDEFNLIDPGDVVGEEPLEASPARLSESLGARALLTASVGAPTRRGYGDPPRVEELRMTLSLSAKRLPSGASVASVSVTETSPKMTPSSLSRDEEAVRAALAGALAEKAASELLASCGSIDWNTNGPATVEVAFGCNLPGAEVSIDGICRGTAGTIGEAPLRLAVPAGIHGLRIACPGTEAFEVRALFEEGTTFMVVLRENEEGRKRRMEDRRFGVLMDRIEKAGATDDDVRLLRAEGYGAYLRSSFTRLQGMPQTISVNDCAIQDPGLSTVSPLPSVSAPSDLP